MFAPVSFARLAKPSFPPHNQHYVAEVIDLAMDADTFTVEIIPHHVAKIK